LRFLTREELAEVLQVSVRTVDAMVVREEIPCVRLRGAITRFYLPDVIGCLTASECGVRREPARRRSRRGGE
jgi:excisionase family DNA binding protein